MAWPCRPERAPAAPNWSVSSRPASRCGPGADARVGLGAGFRRRIQELDKKYRSVQKRVLTRFISDLYTGQYGTTKGYRPASSQIGSASCRERVGPSGSLSEGADSLKKKKVI